MMVLSLDGVGGVSVVFAAAIVQLNLPPTRRGSSDPNREHTQIQIASLRPPRQRCGAEQKRLQCQDHEIKPIVARPT